MSCFKNHLNDCDRDRYRYAVVVNRFNTNSREDTRRKMFGEYID